MKRECDLTETARRSLGVAPPEDILHTYLIRLWQRLLTTSTIGIDDDFFELGGTSETCDRLFAASADIFEAPVSRADVRGRLSIRNLASALVARLESHAEHGHRRLARPRSTSYAAPQDILQDRLLDLWERLLDRARVGIDDEFFALGGSQASAKIMFAAIEDLYGERLDERDIATGQLTVRGIANALVRRVHSARVSRVQAGARGVPPLFFLHGDVGGGGYYVRELARGLGPERPVYVLGLHGMHGEDVPESVEGIASDHVAAVSSVRPDGAVCVGGHCLSAIIAFETARQLAAQGRTVTCAVLIEPPFVHDSGSFHPLPPPRLSPEARSMPAVRVAWLLAKYLAIVAQYQYPRYSGRVAVFWAGDGRRPLDVPERRAFVRALAPRAEFHTCRGTHITAPGRYVVSLADLVRRCLDAQPV